MVSELGADRVTAQNALALLDYNRACECVPPDRISLNDHGGIEFAWLVEGIECRVVIAGDSTEATFTHGKQRIATS